MPWRPSRSSTTTRRPTSAAESWFPASSPIRGASPAGGGRDFIDIGTLSLLDEATGEACGQAYVTRKPDFHFTLTEAGQYSLVRFWVVTENEADATLLINDPSGRWRCNDDHGHEDWGVERAPAVDFTAPESGRYDIWVGTYEQSSNNPATLYVTEIEERHP